MVRDLPNGGARIGQQATGYVDHHSCRRGHLPRRCPHRSSTRPADTGRPKDHRSLTSQTCGDHFGHVGKLDLVRGGP
jgi:hypothetical protein